jgi:hydroxymethylbilane synthase
MNARLQGGCQVPIAGHAVHEGETLFLRGLVGTPDGSRLLRAEGRAPAGEAETLGERVADDLLPRAPERSWRRCPRNDGDRRLARGYSGERRRRV